MSWHEPGRDRDPWRDPKEGPPNLDEWLRRARRRVRGWFARQPPRPPGARRHPGLWTLVPPILIGIWLLTGFYRVPADHKSVNLHFGAYSGTSGPGLHWHWPWPIASARLVDMSAGRSLGQQAEVLTKDGKLLDLGLTISYRISNPYRYLFGSRHPDRIITTLADTALARVARSEDFKTLRSNDTAALEKALKTRISAALAKARTGVVVGSVSIGRAALPQSVQQSREELAQVKKDNADQAKKVHAAAKKKLLAVQKKAARLIVAAEQAAQARKTLARERAAHFEALLPAWRKSPDVARATLRANVLAESLGAVSKVVVSGSIHSVTLPSPPASVAGTTPAPVTGAAAESGGP